MDKQKAKRVMIGLFLAGVFALLVIYLISWGLSIVNVAKNVADGDVEDTPTFSCVGLSFDVVDGSMSYDDGVLKMKLTNRKFSEEAIPEMTIISGEEERTIETKGFLPGKTKDIEVEIPLGSSLELYPTGCEMYAKKINLES